MEYQGVRNTKESVYLIECILSSTLTPWYALQPRSSSIRLVSRGIEWGLPEGVLCRPAYVKSFRG